MADGSNPFDQFDAVTAAPAAPNPFDQFDAPAAPSPTLVGSASQGLSGVNEGIADTLGFPVDMANRAIGLGMAGINKVAGTSLQPSDEPMGGSAQLKQMMGGLGAITPPSQVPAEQMLRRIGEGVGASVIPGTGLAGSVERPVAAIATQLGLGATSGAGAAVADQAFPNNPIADTAGSLIGGLAPAAGMSAAMRTAGAATVPTAEALKTAASAGYDAARGMGVEYSSDAVAKVAAALQSKMEGDGILDNLAPKSFSILGKLQNPPPGSTAPLSGIEAARRAFGNAAKDYTNPTEQLAAKRAISGLDAFVENPDPSAVVSGRASDAASVLTAARGNYAAASRSEALTGAEDRADLNAAVANSGHNVDNAIRQRIKALLVSPKASAGYSDAELAGLEQVARGTPVRNTIRIIGNLLGGGGGVGAVISGAVGAGAGESVGGLPGAIAGAGMPAIGMGAKAVANALTRRALGSVDESVRARSPLFMSQPPAPASTSKADIAKLLMLLSPSIGTAATSRSQP